MDRQVQSARFLRWGFIKDGVYKQSNFIVAMLRRLVLFTVGTLGVGLEYILISEYFGNLVSVIAIIMTLLGLAISVRRYGIWEGVCPHCSQEIALPNKVASDCPICVKRILVKASTFQPL
jgi:DNA-directed RNA polymerase subunit RPC12/RpoP